MNPGLPESLKTWLDAALGFFYPDVCQICRVEPATAAEGYVGANCWSRPSGVRFVRPPFCDRCGLPFDGAVTIDFECSNCRDLALEFNRARAAVVASDLVLDVIHRYKYQQAIWFEPFLFDLLRRQAVPALANERWDVLVPVPLHPLKARERGFNQAERLARRLSLATRIPMNARLVRRVEFTRTQTMLTRSERAANVRYAFAASASAHLENQRVVLVDDVLTTGATTSGCAHALRQAGASEVSVWTVARGV